MAPRHHKALKCILLFLCLYAIHSAVAQQRVTLIIDTLITEVTDFRVFQGTYWGLPSSLTKENGKGEVHQSIYPNFHAEIVLEPQLPIEVPLTAEGGMLHLHLETGFTLDTIRIAKYQLLPICSWDSVVKSVAWWRMDDALRDPIKWKDTVRPVKNKQCAIPPTEISLVINNIPHTILLRPQLQPFPMEHTHFSGFKPRRCGAMPPDSRKMGRCLTMGGTIETWRWDLFGELNLSE